MVMNFNRFSDPGPDLNSQIDVSASRHVGYFCANLPLFLQFSDSATCCNASMKIFVPFEEALLDELLVVGEAIVPFKLEFDKGRVSWDQVELLDDASGVTAAEPTISSTLE